LIDSLIVYIFGCFVLLPALRKKLKKSEKESSRLFDNFLYCESTLKELNKASKDPAVWYFLGSYNSADMTL
jgi:hypothetical protein